MPSQGTDAFPPEIWLAIFAHARNPIPLPLSRPPRSELRQQALTSLARVCKLFNEWAIPLLYKHPITDSYRKFFDIKLIPSRRRLLALVESLHIEYHAMEMFYPYESLLKTSKAHSWNRVGPDEDGVEDLRMDWCYKEAEDIWFATRSLLDTFMISILPRLKSISVGSIYGHQGDLWSRFDDYDKECRRQMYLSEVEAGDEGAENTGDKSEVMECRAMWAAILGDSNVRHLCVRDPSSPLGLDLSYPFEEQSGNLDLQVTLHFSLDTPALDICFGKNPTWMSEVAQSQLWGPMYDIIGVLLTDRLMDRDMGVVDGSTALSFSVYGSTASLGANLPYDIIRAVPISRFVKDIPAAKDPILSIDTQRAIAKAIGCSFTERLRRYDAAKDTVRWYPSHDYAGCKACGSGPPL